ncbi:MmgE/PrpD family protein [Pseudomonas sp. No.117]
MTLTLALARRICDLTWDDLSATALANAKIAILDTLGCALAGAHEPVVETLLRTPGLATPGAAGLFGRRERLEPLCAALINGAAAHALDFDDVNIAMGGHPSAPLLPALLALSQTHDCSGAELLLAFIAGFETETRLARSVNFHHYDKGWHPTATLGVFGAAAACAKLLGLDEQRTAMALALCVSLASGVKANFGTMTKPFHVGHSARHGLLAALLAERGFTASSDALEHPQGFYEVFNGRGHYDATRALADWGAPLDIEYPGIGIKLYPCCDSTHASLDALFSLQREAGFTAADVETVRVRIHPLRLTHVNRPELRNALDAKFSVQYCLARALLDGRIVLDSFTPEAYEDPAAQALMTRIDAAPHPDPTQAVAGHYLTRLEVDLRDGRQLTLQLDHPHGRTAEQPAPFELIATKYQNCASQALPAEAVRTLQERIVSLEEAGSVRELAEFWAQKG